MLPPLQLTRCIDGGQSFMTQESARVRPSAHSGPSTASVRHSEHEQDVLMSAVLDLHLQF